MIKTIRISNRLYKRYPAKVAMTILDISSRYHIKSFKDESVMSHKVFTIGEGESYTGIKPDGTVVTFEVVAAHNIGASGLSYKIGERFSMPAGTYLINVYYYTKYFMTVYCVQNALPDRNESLYNNSY